MVFFLATLVTAAVFITDRTEGIWERTLVAGNKYHFLQKPSFSSQLFSPFTFLLPICIFLIGITTPELLLAHIVTQAVIVFLQCTEVIFFVGVVFGTVNNGNNLTVIFLLSLTGFAGMLFGMFVCLFIAAKVSIKLTEIHLKFTGMLISIFCESHTMANFVSTGAFYPMIVLCGLLWPLEGMPQLLRDFALLLPFTVPTISVCLR